MAKKQEVYSDPIAEVEEVATEVIELTEVRAELTQSETNTAPVEQAEVRDPLNTHERIKLLISYGGRRTREHRLAPGVYVADDIRGYGMQELPEYLVANGHAVWVES